LVPRHVTEAGVDQKLALGEHDRKTDVAAVYPWLAAAI
jgi:hypothetical protein